MAWLGWAEPRQADSSGTFSGGSDPPEDAHVTREESGKMSRQETKKGEAYGRRLDGD